MRCSLRKLLQVIACRSVYKLTLISLTRGKKLVERINTQIHQKKIRGLWPTGEKYAIENEPNTDRKPSFRNVLSHSSTLRKKLNSRNFLFNLQYLKKNYEKISMFPFHNLWKRPKTSENQKFPDTFREYRSVIFRGLHDIFWGITKWIEKHFRSKVLFSTVARKIKPIEDPSDEHLIQIKYTRVVFRLKMVAFKRYRRPKKCSQKWRKRKENCCWLTIFSSK